MGRETDLRRSRSCRLPLAVIAVFSAVSAAGTLAAPALLWKHPLLLIALTPRATFLLLAAPHVGFVSFFAVAVARAAAVDPFHFLLGRHGAHLIEARMPRVGRIVARAERLIRAWGLVAVGLRPIGPVMAAAGAGGLAVRPVAVANLLGTVAQTALIYQGSRSALFPALLAAAAAVAVAGLAAGAVRRFRSSPALAARRALPASP